MFFVILSPLPPAGYGFLKGLFRQPIRYLTCCEILPYHLSYAQLRLAV
jgi:hypothetical protein